MFSGGVRLGGLDDFLGPAQDCIAPLLVADGKVTISSKEEKLVEKSVKPDLIKAAKTTGTAEVSLSDCLACSGCVTSAETILLQEQSVEEFTRRAGEDGTLTIVSVSPESLCSLSEHFGLSAWDTLRKLSFVLSSYKVHFVCDMHAAHAIHRWERGRRVKRKEVLLSSTCPGWTLYAEKVCDASILPFLSPLRSPQHIQGVLIKRHFGPCAQRVADVYSWTRLWETRVRPYWGERIYHVMVSPCFDRKIEAVRPQYVVNGEREVDTVLATTEILSLLPEDFAQGDYYGSVFSSWNLRELTCLPKALRFWEDDEDDWKQVRHDLYEKMGDDNSKVIRAYGFKNIQNAIRRVRTLKEKISIIEVMACPSACLNGGGQIRGAESTEKLARLAALWPSGEIPEEEALKKFYLSQPPEVWETQFHSLKGNSLKW